MAWQLDIHTIDVGVGESSLIVAEDPTIPGSRRSMLIDGGLAGAAQTVHNKVVNVLGAGEGPNYILVSHYDVDHSNGIANLLLADNLTMLCSTIAGVAAPYAVTALPLAGGGRQQIAAKVAAAAAGAMWGSWGANAANVNATAMAAGGAPGLGALTDAQAAASGATAALNNGPYNGATLVQTLGRRRGAAQLAGVAAAVAVAAGHAPAMVRTAIEAELFRGLRAGVLVSARFQTGGIYRTTQIIDIGPAVLPAAQYMLAVHGGTTYSPAGASVPGVNRVRNPTPALGTELFWGGAAPAPGAPVAVLVTGPVPMVLAPTGQVWQGPHVAAAPFNSGSASNDVSLGVVIRFNQFMYFTAGDLPTQGEDLLYPTLLAAQLPDGTGGALAAPAPPPPLAAFKAGHHGSSTSTSANMLGALLPFTAAISVGFKYNHPDQPLINLLQGQASLTRVYLTNCRYPRANVLASPAVANGAPPPAGAPAVAGVGGSIVQDIIGNKSRIAGDNAVANIPAPGGAARQRGDIVISVTAAGSTAGVGARTYSVTYWENYPPHPPGPVVPGAPGPAPIPGMNIETTVW